MKLADYNDYCRELGGLAAAAKELEGLDDNTRLELARIHENIEANHFRIVLLGSFQSGKSTIFNTACGGRELSPTGIGIRTSAVPAEAHVVPEGEPEFARIRWKNDDDLLAGFLDSILPELIDLDKRFKGCNSREVAENLDLASDRDRKLLGSALSDARQHYDEHRKEFSSDHRELLLIGTLILKNYKWFQANLKDNGERHSDFSVEDATRVIRFPSSWNQYPDPREFGWEDVRFLFIKSVEFHLDSPDLRKLRAVLIDCPGLHASRWDNEVIRDCISRSDAIVLLQGGEGREMSQSDLDDASRLGDYGITSNGIFLAFNSRGSSKKASRRILDSNLHKIKEALNLELPGERIVIFNALLALRAMQSRSLQEGVLPPASIEALSNKSKLQWDEEDLPENGSNPEENTRFLLNRDLRNTASQFLGCDVDDPSDSNTIEKLIEQSCWRSVVSQASEFVIKTRARTRLIDKGADRIAHCLTRSEEDLRATEASADKSLEEHELEKAMAEKALDEFDTGADALIKRISDAFEDFRKTDQGVGGRIAGELSHRLSSPIPISRLKKRLSRAIDNAQSEREVHTTLQDVSTTWMHEIITGWQVDVRNGKSDAVKAFYAENLASYTEKVRELLEKAIGRSGGLLRKIPFKAPEIDDDLLIGACGKAFDRSLKHLDQILDEIDTWLWGRARIFRDGYEAVRNFLTGSPFDRDAWKNRLEEYVGQLRNQISESIVPRTSEELILAYQVAIRGRIERTKERLRVEFEEEIEKRDINLSRALKEREALAKEAARIRSEVIEPFHGEIREFAERVADALAEPEIQ